MKLFVKRDYAQERTDHVNTIEFCCRDMAQSVMRQTVYWDDNGDVRMIGKKIKCCPFCETEVTIEVEELNKDKPFQKISNDNVFPGLNDKKW